MIFMQLKENEAPSQLSVGAMEPSGSYFNFGRTITMYTSDGRIIPYQADRFVMSRIELVDLRDGLTQLLEETIDAFVAKEDGGGGREAPGEAPVAAGQDEEQATPPTAMTPAVMSALNALGPDLVSRLIDFSAEKAKRKGTPE